MSVYAELSSADVCHRPVPRIHRLAASAANSRARSGSGRPHVPRTSSSHKPCASRGTCVAVHRAMNSTSVPDDSFHLQAIIQH